MSRRTRGATPVDTFEQTSLGSSSRSPRGIGVRIDARTPPALGPSVHPDETILRSREDARFP